MNFGDKLKRLRFEKGLTQDDMGYVLNVTKSCICCYENGTREPSLKMLIQISNYFRVSIDYLINNKKVKLTDKVRFNDNDLVIIELLKNNPIVYENILHHKNKWINEAKKINVE